MENLNHLPTIQSLRFEELYLSYENKDPILSNVDFQFPQGEVIWLKSSEGAGKSSLLQLLAGLTVPTMGKYLINEDDVSSMSFEEFLPYRLSIGYSFDYGGLISNRTLFDNLMLPLVYHKILDPESAKLRIHEVERRFDISKHMQERPAHVSGRIRKLICLIRAIITWPQVLLMDDPSVGIGLEAQQILFECIGDLRQKGRIKHVFISSYDEKFIKMFNPTIVHLEDGQLYLDNNELDNQVKKVVNI